MIFATLFRTSLRKHPFLLAFRRCGRFDRRNVCDSTTEIPYWWRKICPESGQKRWLVDGVVTLYRISVAESRTFLRVKRPQRRRARRNGCFRRLISDLIKNLIPYFRPEALEFGAWPERMTSCYGTYTVVGVNIKREMVLSIQFNSIQFNSLFALYKIFT